MKRLTYLLPLLGAIISCSSPDYDVIIRNGIIYDGSGSAPISADLGIKADTIAFIGDLKDKSGAAEIDAEGKAVSPGFINMLSWATESIITDPRSMSNIRQGVTLEVFGEGGSMGPLSDKMKAEWVKNAEEETDITPQWTTLGEYLEYLETKGVTPNVASFIGATTLRIHTVDYDNRPPTEEELDSMRLLVKQGMEEGALGIGSSLIYAPAFYASTEELIELCKVAAPYGGRYITHMRSEGNQLLEAVDETIRIAREAGLPAEIYHLKVAGTDNWWKMDTLLSMIEEARAEGIQLTTDMYTYTAGATGLDASMPPWVQEGGPEKWRERLQNPDVRKKVIEEMRTATNEWENLLLSAGSPERVVLLGFKNDSLKPIYTGKTLAEAAAIHGKSVEETAIDLVIADETRVGTAYFMMSEENVKRQIQLPYMSFCSDAGSVMPEGKVLESSTHPRTYGNFARLLGKYVREEKVISLEEAIRKLSSMPAENMGIRKRGRLVPGYYADVVIFDPATIQDHATFENPHQLSTGVTDVWVNGVQVLSNSEHTGSFPGRAVRGPGWIGYKD
ncbi:MULTISPECIES: amidohydrolase family protein [unclassified Imperialibacter]|uniref:N-acyl-D-amino-acid deacylase family protein n=1 Tax=unclassified Imperialibacter TaxID=2629706 RepID=UPI001259C2E5|nr:MULTISPECIES: D-aminoacylase [unclassified Imperialibacter]CAD5257418.1 Aminoacylase [Imperialibacter sp. 75]CAD5260322.1 Aminoacylase [Imperialibacter sp. 89]VVT25614.1 N-acyl-D-amino-acid deacylase [Imperialibacter sp. EC-SDR9]